MEQGQTTSFTTTYAHAHHATPLFADAMNDQIQKADPLMTPRRVQLSRKKGWQMPENTVKVDRTTKWGNPFVVGEHGTRADCVLLFENLLGGLLCVSTGNRRAQEEYMAMAKRDREQLRGKNLACWCPQGAQCHADVLIVMANFNLGRSFAP